MSNLRELLDSIKVQQAQQNESYVSYEKSTGKIYKITNRRPIDTEYEIVSVATEIVKPILEGTKSVSDFVVVYDFSLKQVVVKEINYEDHYNSAESFIHEFSRTINGGEGHFNLEKIYDGVSIDIFIKQDGYRKDQLVFFNNNVYRFLKDNELGEDLNFDNALLFVEDVKLSDISTRDHVISLEVTVPIYDGIHVDVWYKELDHVTGQHVYHNGNVYKIKKDQKKNTNFSKRNCELIVENVILYDDSNKDLKFQDPTTVGDKFLDNNKLYMIDINELVHNHTFGDIFFYSGNNLIEYNNDGFSVINLTTKDIYSIEKDFLKMHSSSRESNQLTNGDKLLIGKELYSFHSGKVHDLLIRQNNQLKRWELILDPATKKFITLAGYSKNDTVYFSVTEKYDPNILLKSITVSVEQMIRDTEIYLDFDDGWDPTEMELSIYTTKYFENYGYEIFK